MIVCHCYRATCRDIRDGTAPGNLAGTACGGCRPQVEEIRMAYTTRRPDGSSPPERKPFHERVADERRAVRRERIATKLLAALLANPRRYDYIAGLVEAGTITQDEATEKNVNKAVRIADALLKELAR